MNYSAIFMSFSLRWPSLSRALPFMSLFPFRTSHFSVAGKVGKVKVLKVRGRYLMFVFTCSPTSTN